MKKFLAIFSFCSLIVFSGFSQTKNYWSTGGEMLLSFANIDDMGVDESSALRWAPVINLQGTYNIDFSKNAGIYTGIAFRNVGYIYDNYQERTPVAGEMGDWYKKKFRSYNIALPIGVKFGNLDNVFFYGGYEIDFPIVYKEKTFDQGDKIDKITGWFSERQEKFQHGVVAGIQFPYDFTVKFKYYLSEFHNQDFKESDGTKPYSGLKSNIFYFSLGYNFSWDE